jgi:replicative DNA helicase
MLDLYKHNRPIDIITVKDKLDSKKLLDKVGGISYITELVDIVPTSSNIFEYASIVKNK